MKDTDNDFIEDELDIASDTLSKCRALGENEIKHFLQRPRNYKASRISAEQKKELERIVDKILPTISGRSWRKRTTTFLKLYEKYCEEFNVANPGKKHVGLSKFTAYLQSLHVHYSPNTFICPLCADLAELERLDADSLDAEQQKRREECKEHVLVFKEQYNAYTAAVRGLKFNQKLIVLDYTDLDFVNHSFQDLIICIYTRNSDGSLSTEYRHFIGNKNDSNDVYFTVKVWNILKQSGAFNCEKLDIWTDGGPKHFKLSSLLFFFSVLQQEYQSCNITYNYFESYHGHGICDVLAAQAKKLFRRIISENEKNFNTATDVVNVICQLSGHRAERIGNIDRTLIMKVGTMSGIKSYWKYRFPKCGQVAAFIQEEQQQVWDIKKIRFPHGYLGNIPLGFYFCNTHLLTAN